MLTFSELRPQIRFHHMTWDVLASTGGTREASSLSSYFYGDFSMFEVCSTELVIPEWFEFQHLVDQWRKERGATSSSTEMALCPSYQSIIGMGETALPLILRQVESEGAKPDHWFWALRAITRTNPVPAHARGNMREMARIWLDWARHRYVW